MNMPMYKVYDFFYDVSVLGNLAANAKWTPTPLTPSIDEIFEPFHIEVFPPVNIAGTLDTFKEINIRIATENYKYMHMREFMAPPYSYNYPVQAISLGNPVLGVNPFTGRRGNILADPVGSATPKVGPREQMGIQVQNDATLVDRDFCVRVHYWRFKGKDEELRRVLGMSNVTQQIVLENPYKGESEVYTKPTVPISLADFHTLSGGHKQELPKIFPFWTWAQNLLATTPNNWYNFDFEIGHVDEDFKDMHWNFDKTDAVLIMYYMIQPGANIANARIHLESRGGDSEQLQYIVQNNDLNQLPVPQPTDGTQPKRPFIPMPLAKPQLIWNDKGGPEILDNGTAIAINAVTVGIIGRRFELR